MSHSLNKQNLTLSEFLSYIQKNFYLDLRSLALFRVGLGLIILQNLWSSIPYLDTFYGPNGLCPLSDPVIKKNLCYSLFALGDSHLFLVSMILVFAFFAVLLTLGLWTRAATTACLVLHMSLLNRGPMYLNSGDMVLKIFLMWGLFLPLGQVFSLDSRMSPKARPMPLRYASAATVCLILQIAVIYIENGFEKSDALWAPGYTAVHFALGLRDMAKPFAMVLLPHYNLLKVASFLVLNLERYAFFLIALPFFPGLFRIFLIVAFTVFHVMIDLTLDVGWFSWVMLTGLSALIPSVFWDFVRKKKTLEGQYHKKNNLLFLLFTLVLFQSIKQSDLAPFSRKQLPSPIQKVMSSLNFKQRWKMFAPKPPFLCYTVYIYPIYKKVEGCSYPSRMVPLEGKNFHRWIKYLWNFREKKYKGLLYQKHLKAYLIREWNDKNPGKPIEDLEIIAKEEYYQIKTVGYYFTGWILL